MLKRFNAHLRSNIVGYLALFVALGGTSYAATALPRNSVGTAQLRRHSVTQAKLGAGLGGEVFAVTELNEDGGVVMSTPKKVKVEKWGTGQPGLVNTSGLVYYPTKIPKACAPVVTPENIGNQLGQDHLPNVVAGRAGFYGIQISEDAPTYVLLSIVCPK